MGGEETLAGSLAHTRTSWDYSFGLTVNPVVCEFVCFGQIITSCFLEDTASFPREGSRSYQAAGMCGVNKTKRSEPPPGAGAGGAGEPEYPGVAIPPTSQALKESQEQVRGLHGPHTGSSGVDAKFLCCLAELPTTQEVCVLCPVDMPVPLHLQGPVLSHSPASPSLSCPAHTPLPAGNRLKGDSELPAHNPSPCRTVHYSQSPLYSHSL